MPDEAPIPLHSAGGVVWRRGPAGTEVLLIHRRRPAEWRLPKGKLKPGETPEQAAVREVGEETGVLAEVEHLIGSTTYTFRDRSDGPLFAKRVDFYLMRPIGGRVTPEPEMDAAGFVPLTTALRLLTFDNERKIVEDTR